MHTVNVFTFILYTHSFSGDGIYVGKLTPVTVTFRVTNIKETTTQKYSHTHKNHTIHYTQRHTHSHGQKCTLLTIMQLLPGTTVISHITLFINYFLLPGALHSFPEGIRNQFALYTKISEKASTFSSTKLFLPK